MKPPKLSSAIKLSGYILLLLAAVVPILFHRLSLKPTPEFLINNLPVSGTTPAQVSIGYACEECLVPSVHGSNLVETLDGGMLATWFGGSREGGTDVVLWGANFSPETKKWSKPRHIVGPAETQTSLGRYIKTVGNSVLVRGEQGGLWLYFVSVSLGGWAGSALNVMQSQDDGITWDAPRRLITSPFFNISSLNKSAAVHYSDGTIGLPIYHEFIGKFSELLHLDNTAQVLEKIRITQGRHSIQPLLLPLDHQHAIALMRDTGPKPGHVLKSRSDDGGKHWSTEESLAILNPDSAVAGLRRPDGSLLLVFNDTESGRHSLALAVSRDQGQSWSTIRHFEQTSEGKGEFSYPYLIRNSNGTMQLLYTWNRKRIRHVSFNDNWVDGSKP